MLDGLFKYFSRGKEYEDNNGTTSNQKNYEVEHLNKRNAFYGAVSKAFEKGVVPTGFNVQSRTGKKEFDKQFDKYIKQFSKRGLYNGIWQSFSDLTDKTYFAEAQTIMVREYASKSGGVLIRHVWSNKYPLGYKYELISVSAIDMGKHNPMVNLYNGIQLDMNGKIKSIWIKESSYSSKSHEYNYKYLTLLVNRWADIHQYTAISPLLRVIESLEYIDNYKAKELKGAGVRADTPLILKTPYYNQMYQNIKNKFSTQIKNGTIKEADLLKDFFDLRRFDTKDAPRKFEYIADDEDVVEIGKSVDTIYDMAWQNEMRSASSAIGLNASSTAGLLNNSYNEALKANQSEEQEFAMIADRIVENALREIIEYRLLFGLVKKGLIKVDFENLQEYQATKWMRRRRKHIDPTKEEKSITEAIEKNKTISRVDALADKGTHYEEYISEEVMYERKKMEEDFKLKEELLKKEIEIKKKYEDAGIQYDNGAK